MTKKSKIITIDQVPKLIPNGATLAVTGFVQMAHPEQLSAEVEKSFLETGAPRDLTLIYGAGQGNGKDTQVNRYGHEGLLKRVIGGHFNLAPKVTKLIGENKMEGYNFPQGVILHCFRSRAAGLPGHLTHVGLKTFADPRLEGGKLNDITKEQLVEVVTLGGKEQLYYKTFDIDVAFIRATTADEKGNLTMEKEGLKVEALPVAQATKNSGGIVIAQVERITQNGTLDPRMVEVPGICVDYIVIAEPEYHKQTGDRQYDPAKSGEIRIPLDAIAPMPFDVRKVIARRCFMELEEDSIVNLGIGVPEGVASVANEEGKGDVFTLTVEAGPVGGVPNGGPGFGSATNPEMINAQHAQFDFYDGGGLDVTFLGLAEADEKGNINVSKFGPRIAGCGGFVNISQNAKKAVFCGTFTAGGLKLDIKDGQIKVVQEGKEKKFVKSVQQVTFSGQHAAELGQPVLYITERAVFELSKEGPVLKEIAPGIDLQKDILGQMDFEPKIDENLKIMDARIFTDAVMNL